MGDLKLSANNFKVSSLIQGAQKVSPADASAAPTPVPAAAQPADQRVAKALPGGQAHQSLSFVDSPAAPTAADIDWAKRLEAHMAEGYQPDRTEIRNYNRIAEGLEASRPVPSCKPLEQPVSAHESQWAVALEDKVAQGTRPNAEELAAYQNITYRELKADQPPVPNAGVSRQELDWALNLQRHIAETGYHPNDGEIKTFADISRRQNAAQAQPDLKPGDREWADQLQQKITHENYQPSPDEIERYTEIYQALQAGTETVSSADIAWASQLQKKADTGYRPNDLELERFGDIQRRLNLQDPGSIRPEDRVLSQHELDWATQLQQSVTGGVPASEREQQRYEEIYRRYQR